MQGFINPVIAYFVLRVIFGLLLISHGYPKLKNFSGFAGFIGSLGFKPAKFWAAVAVVAEFVGGILMVLGLLVPLVGALFAIQMLIAMIKTKWGKVGLTAQGGWELDLIYFAVALLFAAMGAGAYAL